MTAFTVADSAGSKSPEAAKRIEFPGRRRAAMVSARTSARTALEDQAHQRPGHPYARSPAIPDCCDSCTQGANPLGKFPCTGVHRRLRELLVCQRRVRIFSRRTERFMVFAAKTVGEA